MVTDGKAKLGTTTKNLNVTITDAVTNMVAGTLKTMIIPTIMTMNMLNQNVITMVSAAISGTAGTN